MHLDKTGLMLLFFCIVTAISFGCVGGNTAASQKNRFVLNSFELANGSTSNLIIDFNYTASRSYPDLSFYLGPDFFWVEKDGTKCTAEISSGEEMSGGSAFEPSAKTGLDGRVYNSFHIGRDLNNNQQFRVVLDAKLNKSCSAHIGDAVRVHLSAVENQNDLNEVVNPYHETVQGIVSASAFGSAYDKYVDSTKEYYNSMSYFKEKVIVAREAFDAYKWKFLPTGTDGVDFEIKVRKVSGSTPMAFEALEGKFPFTVFKMKNNLINDEYLDCQLEKSSLVAIDENGHQMKFSSGSLNVSTTNSFTIKGKINGCGGTKGSEYEYKAVVGSVNIYDYQRNYTDVFSMKGNYE